MAGSNGEASEKDFCRFLDPPKLGLKKLVALAFESSLRLVSFRGNLTLRLVVLGVVRGRPVVPPSCLAKNLDHALWKAGFSVDFDEM